MESTTDDLNLNAADDEEEDEEAHMRSAFPYTIHTGDGIQSLEERDKGNCPATATGKRIGKRGGLQFASYSCAMEGFLQDVTDPPRAVVPTTSRASARRSAPRAAGEDAPAPLPAPTLVAAMGREGKGIRPTVEREGEGIRLHRHARRRVGEEPRSLHRSAREQGTGRSRGRVRAAPTHHSTRPPPMVAGSWGGPLRPCSAGL
jgi:hypothetical protein